MHLGVVLAAPWCKTMSAGTHLFGASLPVTSVYCRFSALSSMQGPEFHHFSGASLRLASSWADLGAILGRYIISGSDSPDLGFR